MATTAERGGFVRDLISSCREGSESLTSIPQLVKVIIEDEMWKGFYIEEMDKIVSHDDFESFIVFAMIVAGGGACPLPPPDKLCKS